MRSWSNASKGSGAIELKKLNRIKMLEPQVPIVRYEHARPGDLLHVDIKKLARVVKPGHRIAGNPQDQTSGAGWEFLVYVAIDDFRVAFTAVLPDKKPAPPGTLLREAVLYFARLGILPRRVMTDNGPCFCSNLFAQTCRQLQIKPIRTQFYMPRLLFVC